MKHSQSSIVWFRKDLRLEDNPALLAACSRGGPVIPLYIWEGDDSEEWQMGSASKWWLHQSLVSLDRSLKILGSRLIICRGNYLETLQQIIRQTGATAAFWNQDFEPSFIAKEQHIIRNLEDLHLTVKTFNGSWLLDPATVTNQSGNLIRYLHRSGQPALLGQNPTSQWQHPLACFALDAFPLLSH